MFSDKYLKKWYHLPTDAFLRPASPRRFCITTAFLRGEFTDIGRQTARHVMRPMTPTYRRGENRQRFRACI
jgi:hypothetical protein